MKKTIIDTYFALKEVLEDVKKQSGIDDYFYRAIKRLLKLQKEQIENEYVKFKQNVYSIDDFLKLIFVIAGINYEDIKVEVDKIESKENPDIQRALTFRGIRDNDIESKTENRTKSKTSSAFLQSIKLPTDSGVQTKQALPNQQKKPEQLVLLNVKSEDLREMRNIDELIMQLCLNGICLNEISINKIPVPLIENKECYAEKKPYLAILKSSIERIISVCIENGNLTYVNDVIRVLELVLGKKSSINMEKSAAIEYYRSGRSYVSIETRCFTDPNSNDINRCTMEYILQRLKRSKNIIWRNESEYQKANRKAVKKDLQTIIKKTREIDRNNGKTIP